MTHADATPAIDPMPHPPGETVIVRPGASVWARAVAGAPDPGVRAALGLPTDGPLVMTGHQAEFWHPGVLAKYLAGAAWADRARPGAPIRTAWLVVDQDTNDPRKVRVPVLGAASGPRRGPWPRVRAAAASLGPPTPDIATGWAPPIARPRWSGIDGATPREVRDGLDRMRDALERAGDAPSLSTQVAGANASLLAPHARPDATLMASALAAADVSGAWLDWMQRDPERCVRAYNGAAAAHPAARLRPLGAAPGRVELPLWRISRTGPAAGVRRAVFASTLPGIPRSELAPKALLMTALLRAYCCDLFIHGLGGERYEPAMERWLEGWLGDADGRPMDPASPVGRELRLAPAVAVSATRYLPMEVDPPPTPEAIARAIWLAHRARHDPGMLDDDAAGVARSAALARIATLPRRSPQRAAAYAELHRVLERARAANADAIRALRADADAARARAGEAAVVFDRTWAWPLHPPALVPALRAAITRELSIQGAPRG